LVEPLTQLINKTITDFDGRRSLTIGFRSVTKVFLNPESDMIDRLTKFYQLMAENKVQYLEKAVLSVNKKQELILILTPVGVQRMPSNLSELKIAIACILKTLQHIHDLKWAHLDIRWPNIILFENRFYLIDCEFAYPFNSQVPEELKNKDPDSPIVCIANDLYLVGLLLNDCSNLLDSDGKEFNKLLLGSQRFNTDARSLFNNKWFTDVSI